MIRLMVNNIPATATAGEKLLAVIRRLGFIVPALCHLEGVLPRGACRLCLVELGDMKRPVPACATPAADGMEIITDSERLTELRRISLELIFAERNHTCSVCVSSGRCELQTLAEQLGVSANRFDYLAPALSVDISHSRYGLDHNRCILCTRCLRVCDQIEGAHTIDLKNRGGNCRIIFDLDVPWGESRSCTACGKCVQSCPTGAMFEKGATVASQEKHPETIARLTAWRPRETEE